MKTPYLNKFYYYSLHLNEFDFQPKFLTENFISQN